MHSKKVGKREHSVSRDCLWAIESAIAILVFCAFKNFHLCGLLFLILQNMALGKNLQVEGTRGERGKVGPVPVLRAPRCRWMCSCVSPRHVLDRRPSTLFPQSRCPPHSGRPCPASQASFTGDPDRSLAKEARSP